MSTSHTWIFSVNPIDLKVNFDPGDIAFIDVYVDYWFNHRDWHYASSVGMPSNPSGIDGWERCYYQVIFYPYNGD